MAPGPRMLDDSPVACSPSSLWRILGLRNDCWSALYCFRDEREARANYSLVIDTDDTGIHRDYEDFRLYPPDADVVTNRRSGQSTVVAHASPTDIVEGVTLAPKSKPRKV